MATEVMANNTVNDVGTAATGDKVDLYLKLRDTERELKWKLEMHNQFCYSVICEPIDPDGKEWKTFCDMESKHRQNYDLSFQIGKGARLSLQAILGDSISFETLSNMDTWKPVRPILNTRDDGTCHIHLIRMGEGDQ